MEKNKNHNNELALRGEGMIFEKLKELGLKPEWLSFDKRNSFADIVVTKKDGIHITIDVKTAYKHIGRQKDPIYCFNTYHHNIKQTGIDFYICICMDDNLCYVFPQKLISGKNVIISDRQIKHGRYSWFLENWKLIEDNNKDVQFRQPSIVPNSSCVRKP